ncbi:hypothetical protein [Xanthomonas translucens]|uniref:hypothetical protein n=1 Tax=Xanthomonas campestris pv. translucens TaxID=343 RepID=UPI000B218D37|nr:hypothetical protein [Xanthomonas translucens]
MADGTRDLELANLVCRFGDKVLLDHFHEIVRPALFDNRTREYGSATYFFSGVELVLLGNDDKDRPLVGVAGRIIKDGQVRREQVYKEGGLVKDHRTMQSSPSAIFLLMLHNHRLIYVKETTGAPDKATFRSTLLSFLKSARAAHIKGLYKKIDELHPTRKKRREEKEKVDENYQLPTLQLIPLATQGSVEEFVGKYDVLKRIKITYRATNDENPMGAFFAQLRKNKDALGSDSASVVQVSKGGLDKEEAIHQITAAAGEGVNAVDLSGTDEGGDTLIGNNDSFQVKKPINNLSNVPATAAHELYSSFSELVDEGLIKLDKVRADTMKKITAIYDRYFL